MRNVGFHFFRPASRARWCGPAYATVLACAGRPSRAGPAQCEDAAQAFAGRGSETARPQALTSVWRSWCTAAVSGSPLRDDRTRRATDSSGVRAAARLNGFRNRLPAPRFHRPPYRVDDAAMRHTSRRGRCPERPWECVAGPARTGRQASLNAGGPVQTPQKSMVTPIFAPLSLDADVGLRKSIRRRCGA